MTCFVLIVSPYTYLLTDGNHSFSQRLVDILDAWVTKGADREEERWDGWGSCSVAVVWLGYGVDKVVVWL